MREIKSNKKNPVRKIFIKICRIFGFEIIDQSNFSIPTSEKSINESISVPGKRSITLPLGKTEITRPIKSLDIILRTCMSVNMLTQSKKRMFEQNKDEYTRRCLISIIKSVNIAKDIFKNIKFKIFIIDHGSTDGQINVLKEILKDSNINFEFQKLRLEEFENQIKNINEENKAVSPNQKSNMSNIHQSIILSKKISEDLIYFVEDDYIHEKESISEILYTYEKIASLTNQELIICPSDYPYLYTGTDNTKIFLGEKRHWRKIDQTLCTFLTSKEIIEKYTDELISMCKFEHYPFEKPLHRIYQKELCISPIPSLAVHFTNINSIYGLSPHVNWKKLWEDNEA
ncbi:MAG: glycosyltransferase group 2 [Candidatus Pelagibacter sp.]|nr:glycosyltransferase group 2 [Candidatus Pelagibacter sp.]|tara:strand:- start:625 stop:1653 length:1029 start_codon:yes stop_codon:yes gene_type:complete